MNTYWWGDYLSKTGLRGRCGRASAGGGLSNQGVLRCLDCTDLVELGGSHLEFSGHLTDGERPAAMHHHPVFTECPLGQDQMIQDCFCFSKTCVITCWPIPPSASKIHQTLTSTLRTLGSPSVKQCLVNMYSSEPLTLQFLTNISYRNLHFFLLVVS